MIRGHGRIASGQPFNQPVMITFCAKVGVSPGMAGYLLRNAGLSFGEVLSGAMGVGPSGTFE